MTNALVPGKIEYYTNLVKAARVAEDAAAAARFAAAATALQPPKTIASTLQNIWNVYTWTVQHPLTSNGILGSIASSMATGNFAEAGKSYNALLTAAGDNYQTGQNEAKLLLKCYAQGGANAVNGLQDAVIDLANLANKVSPAYWALSGLGFNMTINSPDWSNGLFIDEDGSRTGGENSSVGRVPYFY